MWGSPHAWQSYVLFLPLLCDPPAAWTPILGPFRLLLSVQWLFTCVRSSQRWWSWTAMKFGSHPEEDWQRETSSRFGSSGFPFHPSVVVVLSDLDSFCRAKDELSLTNAGQKVTQFNTLTSSAYFVFPHEFWWVFFQWKLYIHTFYVFFLHRNLQIYWDFSENICRICRTF